MTASSPETEALLMKAVDGFVSEAEQAQLTALMAEDPELAREFRELKAMKTTTDAMRARIWADAEMEPYSNSAVKRRWLGSGFLLLFIGAVLYGAFIVERVFSDPDLPGIIKLAFGCGLFGFVFLLAYVFRVRWRSRGRDPYQEIDR